jgi:hypothetical protein
LRFGILPRFTPLSRVTEPTPFATSTLHQISLSAEDARMPVEAARDSFR